MIYELLILTAASPVYNVGSYFKAESIFRPASPTLLLFRSSFLRCEGFDLRAELRAAQTFICDATTTPNLQKNKHKHRDIIQLKCFKIKLLHLFSHISLD